MGLLIGVVGSPKTGKSHFLNDVAQHMTSVVFVAPPTERNSYKSDAVHLHHNWEWAPTLGAYEHGAWGSYLGGLDTVIKDPKVGAIIVDSGSGIFRLAEQYICGRAQKPSFNDMRDFGTYKSEVQMCVDMWVKAAMKYNKHVFVSFHADMREQDGAGEGVKITQTDRQGNVKGVDVVWEQRMMPEMLGSYRQTIAKNFDVWMFTDMQIKGKKVGYGLRHVPDKWSAAGCRVALRDNVPAVIPNTWEGFVGSLDGEVAFQFTKLREVVVS